MPIKQKLLKILGNYKLYMVLGFAGLAAFCAGRALLKSSIGLPITIGIVLVLLMIYLGILWWFFRLKKQNIPMEKLFLLVAIPLGILFLAFLPPGESPDEIMHFKRAYAVTEGHFESEVYDEVGHAGSELPVGFENSLIDKPEVGKYEEVFRKISEPVAEEKSYTAYNNTALYHFLSYLPQEIGILIGKMFGASLLVMAYLAEIFNFALWVVLIYFAIKLVPRFKTIVIFLALLPITLQEATSLAPDALAIGLGIFLIAYVCYLVYERRTRLKPIEIVLLYVMAIMIGYCKIVYLPLTALYLLIPDQRFGSKRAKWIHATCLVILLLVLNLSWLSVSSQYLMEFNPGVNSSEQLMGIIHNPFKYLVVLLNSLNVMGEFYVTSLLGINLGAFTFNLPTIIYLISFGMFVILFAQRDETLKISTFQRVVFAMTFLAVIILTFTSIYIQWSPVGLSFVDGVQGRYFLPVLLLVPLAMVRPQVKTSESKGRAILSINAVVCYLLAVNLIAVSMFFAQNV